MEIIGFANKYYTLWEMSSKDVYRDVCGHSVLEYTTYTYVFKKNISTSIDVVREKYPNIEIDVDLKGHHTFSLKKKPTYGDDCFSYGKYAGLRFADCNDEQYMLWYANNGGCSILNDVLLSRGYCEFDGVVMTIEEYNNVVSKKSKENEDERFISDALKNAFTTIPNSNIKDTYSSNSNYGLLYVKEINGRDLNSYIEIIFKECNWYEYKGFPYAYPILNGKGKMIKNKTLLINEFSVSVNDNGAYEVIVDKFEIVK